MAVRLVAGCEMDYHTSIGAVALVCLGVGYMRLWPLPMIQPWEESTRDPIESWMAEIWARRGELVEETGATVALLFEGSRGVTQAER